MLEVILALLAKEPAHGYEVRGRLAAALGPLADVVSSGQVYVTLGRLEQAGLIAPVPMAGGSGEDRKVYEVTALGRERLAAWSAETSWPRAAPISFHLKLVAVTAARLADPVALIDRHRRALLQQLAAAQVALGDERAGSVAALLLEGTALRLQGDLRWLEACARYWESETGSHS